MGDYSGVTGAGGACCGVAGVTNLGDASILCLELLFVFIILNTSS